LFLITNRKLHTRFRLVLKSTTLDDLELTLNGHALCYITNMSFGARLNEDIPVLLAEKCSLWVLVCSFWQDKIYADIRRGSLERASNVSAVVENGDFSLLSLAIGLSSEHSHPRPQLLHCTM